ncbi:hypothetical protein CQW23_33652 [Capsicum baccatum]|uniref:Exocyst subunit Exo70 family protein n=1 Tax=Capsicum baccatum TaxID=33114 RepID=A0A2G2V151_CAPBA|nr:hypothetical protein CQW23_33652 [Capsicum baccatum]
MNRLEEEFTYLLVHNRQPFEPKHMSFRSSEDDTLDDGSIVSFGDESIEDVVQRDSMSRSSEEYIIELVHPDVIPDLRCIANLMFDSNYGRECSQAFINVRKDGLDDCLIILEVEKLSIEDVLKMEWSSLNSKIRSELEAVSSVCFAEASKASILRLLNFGEAIAIGSHQPEKLIRILDMYEVLVDLIPDINAMYSDEAGLCVRTECQDILRSLGDYAKASFLEFVNVVASSISVNPFPGGGIHHLTRTLLKERLYNFYLAFEDVYKSQTGWSIPDSQLREDLRISTSLKVIQAHRTFVGRHTNHISDKHIKYTADDLENFLLDLFEGFPRSLHGSHRKHLGARSASRVVSETLEGGGNGGNGYFTAFEGKHRFDLYDDNFNSYHSTDVCEDGSVAGSIQSDDWVNVRNVIKFLERFYELILKVSGSRYVTCNLHFEDICELGSYLKECMLARDVLAIPMSSVASKCAFSTGGRIVDPFRSSLTSKCVQYLICVQDWLRQETSPICVEENLEFLEKLELGSSDACIIYSLKVLESSLVSKVIVGEHPINENITW